MPCSILFNNIATQGRLLKISGKIMLHSMFNFLLGKRNVTTMSRSCFSFYQKLESLVHHLSKGERKGNLTNPVTNHLSPLRKSKKSWTFWLGHSCHGYFREKR